MAKSNTNAKMERTFVKNKEPRAIFLGCGSAVFLRSLKINQYGNYDIEYFSRFGPQKQDKVYNIPKQLLVFKEPTPHNYVPSNGIFMINTTHSGRNAFRSDVFPLGYQKLLLYLKKQLDMANVGLITFEKRLKVLTNNKTQQSLIKMSKQIEKLNLLLWGKDYEKDFIRYNADTILEGSIAFC